MVLLFEKRNKVLVCASCLYVFLDLVCIQGKRYGLAQFAHRQVPLDSFSSTSSSSSFPSESGEAGGGGGGGMSTHYFPTPSIPSGGTDLKQADVTWDLEKVERSCIFS